MHIMHHPRCRRYGLSILPSRAQRSSGRDPRPHPPSAPVGALAERNFAAGVSKDAPRAGKPGATVADRGEDGMSMRFIHTGYGKVWMARRVRAGWALTGAGLVSGLGSGRSQRARSAGGLGKLGEVSAAKAALRRRVTVINPGRREAASGGAGSHVRVGVGSLKRSRRLTGRPAATGWPAPRRQRPAPIGSAPLGGDRPRDSARGRSR